MTLKDLLKKRYCKFTEIVLENFEKIWLRKKIMTAKFSQKISQKAQRLAQSLLSLEPLATEEEALEYQRQGKKKMLP